MASSYNFSVGDKKNLYKVLSLDSENVCVDEIKKAYRSMALQCHPDVCPPSRREESTRIATTNSDMGKQTNFYQVLSLRSEYASIEEIKKAYRSMALVYHPDVCPPSRKEEFAQIFIQVQKAYQTLSDPILRKKHDRELGLEQVENGRKIWEEQLLGLKIRSDCRLRRKERES
ncbi:chaperone protein dnaJ 20, chloroplastic-like protein [Cinnamomum micranthum f. kanehirae]|uniref:Chaperone protein dnaJ 20, chloroplastic-like protein n=1 Tax=Cinnamomum micranthum f. kanehirae TaxID=337451 RepID=A0A3S3P4A7_9MAGN|nr:chaperone protein dnaJ 20, chloroplastic-like protein [Cinnamomum micranthum f. kanehirae]